MIIVPENTASSEINNQKQCECSTRTCSKLPLAIVACGAFNQSPVPKLQWCWLQCYKLLINNSISHQHFQVFASTFCLQPRVCYIPHRQKCSYFVIQNARKNLLKMLHFGRNHRYRYSEMSTKADTTVYDDTRWQSSWIMNLEKLAETDIFKDCASRQSTVFRI